MSLAIPGSTELAGESTIFQTVRIGCLQLSTIMSKHHHHGLEDLAHLRHHHLKQCLQQPIIKLTKLDKRVVVQSNF